LRTLHQRVFKKKNGGGFQRKSQRPESTRNRESGGGRTHQGGGQNQDRKKACCLSKKKMNSETRSGSYFCALSSALQLQWDNQWHRDRTHDHQEESFIRTGERKKAKVEKGAVQGDWDSLVKGSDRPQEQLKKDMIHAQNLAYLQNGRWEKKERRNTLILKEKQKTQ